MQAISLHSLKRPGHSTTELRVDITVVAHYASGSAVLEAQGAKSTMLTATAA